jgi:hypothetical protein
MKGGTTLENKNKGKRPRFLNDGGAADAGWRMRKKTGGRLAYKIIRR